MSREIITSITESYYLINLVDNDYVRGSCLWDLLEDVLTIAEDPVFSQQNGSECMHACICLCVCACLCVCMYGAFCECTETQLLRLLPNPSMYLPSDLYLYCSAHSPRSVNGFYYTCPELEFLLEDDESEDEMEAQEVGGPPQKSRLLDSLKDVCAGDISLTV